MTYPTIALGLMLALQQGTPASQNKVEPKITKVFDGCNTTTYVDGQPTSQTLAYCPSPTGIELIKPPQSGKPKEAPKPISTTKDTCAHGDCVFTASPALTGKYFLVLSNPDDGVTIQEFPADKDRQKRYEVSMSSEWRCKATADDFDKPSVVAMVCTKPNVPEKAGK